MRVFVIFALVIVLTIVLLASIPKAPDGTAGRYHQRTRVGNFFDRGETAARYHLRTRVGRFFNRGVC